MATLIDYRGRAYKRTSVTDTNTDEYDGYELIEDAPELIQPVKIDSPLAITTDGKIYDLLDGTYLLENVANFIHPIVLSSYEDIAAVLDDNNNLLIIGGGEYNIIDENVKLFSYIDNNLVYCKNDNTWNILAINYDTLRPETFDILDTTNAPNVNDIIYNDGNILVTNEFISIISITEDDEDNTIVSFNNINRLYDNLLVGSGRGSPVVILEHSNDNYDYKCRSFSIGSGIREYEDERLLANRWVKFAKLQNNNVLIDRLGEVLYVDQLLHGDLTLTPSKIPPRILSLNSNKSSRTRL